MSLPGVRCGGGNSFLCDSRIDALWQRHQASVDLQERAELIKQAQDIVLDEYIFVPMYIASFTLGVGPRLSGSPNDYLRTPTVVLPGPSEDFKLQTGR